MDESLSSLSALSEVGMDDSVTQVLDQARECAVEKVVCPICFEALSDLPNQVGALTFEGKRVESALYHHDCVHNHATNRLVFASETGKAVSPLTRRQVDNFKVMPALTDSEEWVSFLDWNRTGHLDLQKVCFAVAALLPVDDAYARRFVLQVMNLPEDSEEAHEVSQQEVIQTLLPQIRRQLRRLVKTPRPRPPEICRNSEKEELLAWFRFWDSKKEGRLDTSTLQLAVVATFHTALAKTADAATKAAIAQSFCTEMGLRECDHVTEEQFMEKMAPHLVSNLPVAIERNTRSSGFFDPKLSLTLHLRDMKSGAERPLYFETAGEVTVKDLKAATLRRFPVLLCRRTVKIFVMGQQLEDDFQPLFHLRGIYDGTTVNFMAGQRVVETATKPKKKSPLDFDDLAGFDDASDSTSDEDLNRDLYEGNVRCLRQISNESAASRASRGSRLSVGSRPSQNSRRSDSSLKQHLDLAKKNAGKGSPTPSRMSQTSQGLSSPAPSQGPSPQPSPRPSKTRSDMAKSKDKVPSKEKKKEETQEVPVDWQVPECCNESDQAMIPYSRHCTLLGI